MKVEDKINDLPDMPLKTYLKAVLAAVFLAESYPANEDRETPFKFRLQKIIELVGKIADQCLYLEAGGDVSSMHLKALTEAEEAACDAVRYLLRAGN